MVNFLYIVWSIEPDIFTIPIIEHPIRWYSLLWALGLLLSYNTLSFVFKKENKSIEILDRLALFVIIGVIIGARIGHVLFYDIADFIKNPFEIFAIWKGGLASHGGGLGIIIAIYLFCRKEKLSFLYIADRIALVVPLCGGLIRIGNLMNSEIIGNVTDVPWAFIFTRIDLLPRHPTQLYEAIFCFILFSVLLKLYKNNYFNKPGTLLAMLLISLFSFRFFVEFIKIDQTSFENGMLINMGQILSIPFIIIGIVILLKNNRSY